MGEIKLNDIGEIFLNTDTEEVEFQLPLWYEITTGTTRYYPLNSVIDLGVDGWNLVNSGVSFNKYAIFDGASYLNTGYTNHLIGGEFTIFLWFKYDTLSSGGNNLLSLQDFFKTGADNSLQIALYDSGGLTKLYLYDEAGAAVNSFFGNIQASSDEWYWLAYTRKTNSGVLYNKGIIYSGDTSNYYIVNEWTHLTAFSDAECDLDLGSNYTHNSLFYDGQLSGLIIEESIWDTTKLSEQIAKGPYGLKGI